MKLEENPLFRMAQQGRAAHEHLKTSLLTAQLNNLIKEAKSGMKTFWEDDGDRDSDDVSQMYTETDSWQELEEESAPVQQDRQNDGSVWMSAEKQLQQAETLKKAGILSPEEYKIWVSRIRTY